MKSRGPRRDLQRKKRGPDERLFNPFSRVYGEAFRALGMAPADTCKSERASSGARRHFSRRINERAPIESDIYPSE